MRAVVYDQYGPPEVQRLEEVPPPVPRNDEVLVKIHATTVNRLDCHTREANRRIGTAGVQLAKYFGAHVTAVCSTKNLELVTALGADATIDYTKDDFTQNGHTDDFVFDAVGKHSFRRSKRSLKPGGSYLATDHFVNLWLALWTSLAGGKRVRFSITSPMPTKKEVVFLNELVESGRFRPVVDRCYPLEEIVEATRYVETEQKTGNVVLTVIRSDPSGTSASSGLCRWGK